MKNSIKISQEDLSWAVSKGLISSTQANDLWSALLSRNGLCNSLNFSQVAYYFGALIIILAMSWFLSLGWKMFGGIEITFFSLVYAAVFFSVGKKLWDKAEYRTLAGLLITIGVCMIPLAVYGLQVFMGFWPEEDLSLNSSNAFWTSGVHWLTLEIVTVIASLAALKWFPFPFLTAPLWYALWMMSIDLSTVIWGPENTWKQMAWVSLWFGLGMLFISFYLDLHKEEDYAFWGYLFGMLAFWGAALSLIDTELEKFIFTLLNVGFILLSIILNRRLFMVFGGVEIFFYISHLSYTLFEDSLLFPFVLSGIGILIIYIGVLYHRYQARIENAIMAAIPNTFKSYLPKSRN